MAQKSQESCSTSGGELDGASKFTGSESMRHLKSKLEQIRERERKSGVAARELGVTWKDLTVEVAAHSQTPTHENFGSQFNILRTLRQLCGPKTTRAILRNCHGCVKPGEMLLVLGRPGSGCTTLLNVLANRRHDYAMVKGDVHYGTMNHLEARQYRGQIVMNTENDTFFPSLTVGQTLDFAIRTKVPSNLAAGLGNEEFRNEVYGYLMRALNIEHTHDTKVGNESIRGVSGGERKRVSIAECLATRASVYCWDGSTRGLDASTALEYIKTVRTFTDVLGLSTIVTLYQTGNAIFELFDKVLVLDQGEEIYYGPRESAKPFAEKLGFCCENGGTIADFITGITVPTERKIRLGSEATFPRDTKALRHAYEKSTIYPEMAAEYGYPETDDAKVRTELFKEATEKEKYSTGSSFTVSFVAQVQACIIRQYQIIWGDKRTFFTRQVSTMVLALILGSLFYDAPDNSAGLFIKSGALFFALLYNTLVSMAEVANSFNGRPILIKHNEFAFHHPAAFCIGQMAADVPVIMFQLTAFSLILYFMVGLRQSAAAFLTYWIILFATALTTTAMFRAIGAMSSTFDKASKWCGITIGFANLYTGYMFTYYQMRPWFVWIFWIDPLAYAFDGLLSNELHGTIIDCVGNNLVPSGPGYTGYPADAHHQACTGVGGATIGQAYVTGDDHLASLNYSHSHVWRNFGILWPMWTFFAAVTIFFTSRWRPWSDGGAKLLVPIEMMDKMSHALADDEEAQVCDAEKVPSHIARGDGHGPSETAAFTTTTPVSNTSSTLTWNDVLYTVKTPSGDRVLLDRAHGWVKPGVLGALMGASGAGKTTLLDVLSQRKTVGTISGSVLIDGRPLPVSFQRRIGHCEQEDIHEPFATVREALEFSALLRQNRLIPRQEKLAYVDTVLDLLELRDLANTLIGRQGAGLTNEQRKRVAIGVELVAKPDILIFLDEPTSGLDGQAAYNTVRILRKLADAGQAVLVTIHQPSAQVFAQFDTLLLLAKGGKMAYFGDIGKEMQTVKAYFSRNGAPCPAGVNPAEHIIDMVSGQGRDWNELWLSSPEHADVMRQLRHLESVDSAPETSADPSTMNLVDPDRDEFATTLWHQIKLVTRRTSLSLYRNTDYVNNKLILHVASAVFNGFTFWIIDESVAGLRSRLFTIFSFIFVAPGALSQLQPLFIERRNLFEMRESKSKAYSWVAFAVAVIMSEVPYLCACAVLYFVSWYFTVGLPAEPSRAGSTLLAMILYTFVYTGIGQFVAALAPTSALAALVSPILIGFLVPFSGIIVPYSQIQEFWRYWLYYLNPFTYLMGAMLVFGIWNTPVTCTDDELAIIDPAPNLDTNSNATITCGEYLGPYLAGPGSGSRLLNPEATSGCEVCQYANGTDYLMTLNIDSYQEGWRNVGIVAIFALSSYFLVVWLMRLRTANSKKAKWEKVS